MFSPSILHSVHENFYYSTILCCRDTYISPFNQPSLLPPNNITPIPLCHTPTFPKSPSYTPLPPIIPTGKRPFGVSLLYVGWDKHYGLQLYQSDPSGNYGGWRATCIGNNSAVSDAAPKSLAYPSHLALNTPVKSYASTTTTDFPPLYIITHPPLNLPPPCTPHLLSLPCLS